jgi:DNA polymerase-1
VASAIERFNVFSFDLETSGLNPIDSRILLYQIGLPDGMNYVIDSRADIKRLLPYLASPKWEKFIHNAKFEHKFIQYYHQTFINNLFDTMLAEQVIMSEKYSRSLEYVVLKYLEIQLDKSQQKSFIDMKPMEMFSDEQIAYAAKDVEVLFPLVDKMREQLKHTGQENIAQIEFDAVGVVAAMELEGIPVDSSAWRAKLEDYAKEHEKYRLETIDIIYKNTPLSEQLGMFERAGINLNSPKQVADSLISMGIELPTTPKGSYKTDEATLSEISHPVAKSLLEYRKVQKIMSSYGESFLGHIHPFTGRIHPDFYQIGAETGRFSCREPNVQQIPPEFRAFVGNLKDHKIVGADYSQMELRIIAQLSGDPGLIAAFSGDTDPHRATAGLMFNIPLENVTSDQRYVAKTINFGIAYGMGAGKLMKTINAESEKNPSIKKVTLAKARSLVKQHRQAYPKVSDWFYRAGDQAYKAGFSETVSGRKRYFNRPSGIDADSFDKQVAAIKREGGNAPVQGTNADVTKIALRQIYDDLTMYGMKAKIINAVHDEIVVLAHKSHAEEVRLVVEESMLKAAQEVITVVPIKVDSFVSDIWKKG